MTDTSPRFTVLCATYNQAAYLEEMVESVVGQSLTDFELVIVDDGSTDETPQVLESLLQRLPLELSNRITVQRTQNAGQTAALEYGFGSARGEYICLVDSDDRYAVHKLQAIATATERHPEAGMFMHPLRVIDASGRATGDLRPQKARLSHGDIREQMQRTARHSATATTGLILRRDVMARLLPAPTRGLNFAADAYLSFGAACTAPVVALSEPLGDYRMQPGSQYLKRMLSAEGLSRQVEFQNVVAGHFGLQEVARRNSHFARNRFAHAMYGARPARRIHEFGWLIIATVRDPYFSLRQKLTLGAFWTFTLAAGPRRFPSIWEWFQRRQTGWNKLSVGRSDTGAPSSG